MERKHDRCKIKDLAVMAAIILVLAPVLSAGLRHSRELSEQAVCTENLKRLGVACDMYQADWDDVLVPYGAPFNWYPNGHMWPELLDAYIRKIKGGHVNNTGIIPPEYQCPSRLDEIGFGFERTYGINTSCGGWSTNTSTKVVVPLKAVKYPQATIRIAEAMWRAQGGSWLAALPTEYVPGDPSCKQFPQWHSGKGNVLWIDGHVSAMTLAQYNTRDSGAYSGQIWLRLEGPKPAVPVN